MTHWILHVDLDQFIAAVEVLRRPELRGRPVIVGGDGDPAKRGVVATASYEAREHGVHSGLPMRTAARRCPDAVFLPVDRPVYEAASAEVMATLKATPAAFHMTFFGTHPTFTQVPPKRCDSMTAALAPYSAARCAQARPPLPPPMTMRSNA